MRALFAYEWLKLLKKRYVLIALAVFLLLNVLLIRVQFEARSQLADSRRANERQAFLELFPHYEGELDADKAREIIREVNTLEPLAKAGGVQLTEDPRYRTGFLQTEYSLMKYLFHDPMAYAFNYPSEAAEVRQQAEADAVFFQHVGNAEQARISTELAAAMTDRSIPRFSYLEPVDFLFKNQLSSLMLLLVLLAAFSSAFVEERESRMDELNGSSPARNKVALAKMLAALSFLPVCLILFSLSDWLGTLMAYRIAPDWGLPLYALPAFQFSELTLSFGAFYILSAFYRLLAFAFLTLLLLLLSSFFQRSLYAAGLGFGLAAALFFFGGADIPLRWQFLQLMNPLMLLDREALFGTFSRINLFGRLMPLHHLALIVCLLLCFVLAAAVYYRRRFGHVHA